MTEDSGGRRRGSGSSGSDSESDDSRPLTAAGRRQRSRGSEGGSSAASDEKGTPTRSRDAARAATAAPAASPLARLQRFLREVVAELRKVHWPTRRQIVVYTGVVLVFVAFMVTLVTLLDIGFQKLTFALFG